MLLVTSVTSILSSCHGEKQLSHEGLRICGKEAWVILPGSHNLLQGMLVEEEEETFLLWLFPEMDWCPAVGAGCSEPCVLFDSHPSCYLCVVVCTGV